MSLVTLTFDNGPTIETTPYVLEQLKQRDLSAYFCLVGAQLQRGREQVDIAKETLAKGHMLVSHSMTHGVALGDEPTPEHAAREVSRTHELMNELLGEWGAPWFRPFGRGGELGAHLFSASSVDALKSLGYSVLLWNCVPRDWEDIDGWVATAHREINSQDHTVIVLHDLNTGAMKHLGAFLDTLLEAGHVVTRKLPGDCVPIRDGEPAWPTSELREIITPQSSVST